MPDQRSTGDATEPGPCPYVEKSGAAGGLASKTTETAPAPAAAANAATFTEEDKQNIAGWLCWLRWLRDQYPFEQKQLLKDIGCGIADATMTLIQRERVAYDRKLGILEGEIRELKGMLGAALTLLGQKSNLPTMGKSEVVDLPNWRRDRAA